MGGGRARMADHCAHVPWPLAAARRGREAMSAVDRFIQRLKRETVRAPADQGFDAGALEGLFHKRQPVAARGLRETFGEWR